MPLDVTDICYIAVGGYSAAAAASAAATAATAGGLINICRTRRAHPTARTWIYGLLTASFAGMAVTLGVAAAISADRAPTWWTASSSARMWSGASQGLFVGYAVAQRPLLDAAVLLMHYAVPHALPAHQPLLPIHGAAVAAPASSPPWWAWLVVVPCSSTLAVMWVVAQYLASHALGQATAAIIATVYGLIAVRAMARMSGGDCRRQTALATFALCEAGAHLAYALTGDAAVLLVPIRVGRAVITPLVAAVAAQYADANGTWAESVVAVRGSLTRARDTVVAAVLWHFVPADGDMLDEPVQAGVHMAHGRGGRAGS